MLVASLLAATLAALIHVYIFVLESIRWTEPSTRKVFGIASAGEAETLKPMAFNQGFYNLFLAIVTAAGVFAVLAGSTAVGAALVFAGAGSMAAAGVVLLLSSPSKARAALKQLVPPLIAVVLLGLGLVL
jgi:putative membrane protein